MCKSLTIKNVRAFGRLWCAFSHQSARLFMKLSGNIVSVSGSAPDFDFYLQQLLENSELPKKCNFNIKTMKMSKAVVGLVLYTLAVIAVYISLDGNTQFASVLKLDVVLRHKARHIFAARPNKGKLSASELIKAWNQQIDEVLNKQQSTNNKSCRELLEARPPNSQTILNLYRQFVVLRSGNKTKFDILTSREVQQKSSANASYSMIATDLKFYSMDQPIKGVAKIVFRQNSKDCRMKKSRTFSRRNITSVTCHSAFRSLEVLPTFPAAW